MRTSRIEITLFSMLLAAGLGACTNEASPTSKSAGEGEGSATRTVGQRVEAAPTNTFARAVCVCGDLQQAGALTTEAEPGKSADVGILGDFTAATHTSIAGALLTNGAVSYAGDVSMSNDLVSGKDVTGAGDLHVGRNLSCGGGLTTAGLVAVTGTLAVAGEQSFAGDPQVGGTAPYAAPTDAPCGCNAFDVAGAVALAKTTNDDATHGIDPNLATAGDNAITLDAGKYFFADAAAVGQTHFAIHGAVSIYVDGSLDLVGQSQFEIAAGGSLDLYVSGSVGYAGSIVAGGATDPSAFRLYVGGKDAIIAGAGEATYTGFIFAPDATIAFAGTTDVHGALFAKTLEYAGELHVKYADPSPRADAPVSSEMPGPYVR